MDEARVQAGQTALQFVFWLSLGLTVFWCVVWSFQKATLEDPIPEETEENRSEARVMLPASLKHAAITGVLCLLALFMWKIL